MRMITSSLISIQNKDDKQKIRSSSNHLKIKKMKRICLMAFAIVDFYATWCRPCKMTAPVVEELAKDYQGKIDFYKVDIDKEQELATIFGIQSIPTFLFIPLNGQPTAQMGAMQKEDFEKIIKQVLLK